MMGPGLGRLSETVLISVVMPCYNTESYIAEAIGSIFMQGIESVQVIVIDDGSTDKSAEIARSFGDRVACRSQPNRGIAMARNAGITLARGKYLTFLDADDIWPSGSLRVRLAHLQQSNACVFGGIEHFIVRYRWQLRGRTEIPAYIVRGMLKRVKRWFHPSTSQPADS
jgi:glycosyltransferase involved in cell wall biosynthesis